MADAAKIYYNKEPFIQELMIFRLKTSISNSDQPRDNLILFNDNIRSYKFFNDLFTGMPQISIDFEDVNNQEIAKLRADGSTFIRLVIKYDVIEKLKSASPTVEATKNIGGPVTLVHDFILKNVEVINKKSNSTIYRIDGCGYYEAFRNANILYSSKKKKSSTKIVEEMLKVGNYPYDPGDSSSHQMLTSLADGASIPAAPPPPKKLTQADRSIRYIAPVNASLADCIDEVFSATADPGTGIYYLMHHMIKNKAQIISVNDVFNHRKIGDYNYLKIPTSDEFEDLERCLMDLDSTSHIAGPDNYDLVKPVTFHNFDFMNRQWNKDIYTFKRFDDINYQLKGKGADAFQKSYKENPKYLTNQIKFSSNFEPLTYRRLRHRIHQLTMFSDVIQFKCTGHIQRDVGELIALTSGNVKLGIRYAGLWLIVRIYHKFDGAQYYNEIIAVRSDELKPDDQASGTSITSINQSMKI